MLYGSARQLAVSQKVPWPVVGKVVGAGPSEGRGVQSRVCAALGVQHVIFNVEVQRESFFALF